MEKIQCIETYKDKILKKVIKKDDNVNEVYEKNKIELTEERISYLVDIRNLCKRIKDNDKSKIKNNTSKKTNKKDIKK